MKLTASHKNVLFSIFVWFFLSFLLLGMVVLVDGKPQSHPEIKTYLKCEDGLVCYQLKGEGIWCTDSINITEPYCKESVPTIKKPPIILGRVRV